MDAITTLGLVLAAFGVGLATYHLHTSLHQIKRRKHQAAMGFAFERVAQRLRARGIVDAREALSLYGLLAYLQLTPELQDVLEERGELFQAGVYVTPSRQALRCLRSDEIPLWVALFLEPHLDDVMLRRIVRLHDKGYKPYRGMTLPELHLVLKPWGTTTTHSRGVNCESVRVQAPDHSRTFEFHATKGKEPLCVKIIKHR